MRQDQYERLQALEEKLADVFLFEAEPTKWPGAGVDLSAMDQKTRGDRFWCKRNAVATLSLMQRVGTMVGVVQARGNGTTPPAPDGDPDPEATLRDELETEILGAEKEAAKLIRQMKSGEVPGLGLPRKAHGRA